MLTELSGGEIEWRIWLNHSEMRNVKVAIFIFDIQLSDDDLEQTFLIFLK